jgi:hypothetical protein
MSLIGFISRLRRWDVESMRMYCDAAEAQVRGALACPRPPPGFVGRAASQGMGLVNIRANPHGVPEPTGEVAAVVVVAGVVVEVAEAVAIVVAIAVEAIVIPVEVTVIAVAVASNGAADSGGGESCGSERSHGQHFHVHIYLLQALQRSADRSAVM